MKTITREEINDAMNRFLANGGEIQKIDYTDNGFLLNNDMMLDNSYDADSAAMSELQVDHIFEPEMVN